SSRVIQMSPETVPEEVAPALKVDVGKTVIRLDRLRLGNNKPVAFDITWLPAFYGQLIEDYDLSTKKIYGIFEEKFDILLKKGYYSIESENAHDYLVENLEVSKGTALLIIDRLTLTIGEKLIYYQKRYYRTDRIVYEMK